ncbi:MAG: MerR family transcriptional regulator [Pseudooceanicola sp.]
MSYEEHEVVSRVPSVTLRELRSWVREGWVRPREGTAGPLFDEIDVARIRLVCDLRKDLAVPVDTLPVILSLIDQLHATRRDLRCLAEAVAGQSEERRAAILESYTVLREGER